MSINMTRIALQVLREEALSKWVIVPQFLLYLIFWSMCSVSPIFKRIMSAAAEISQSSLVMETKH